MLETLSCKKSNTAWCWTFVSLPQKKIILSNGKYGISKEAVNVSYHIDA